LKALSKIEEFVKKNLRGNEDMFENTNKKYAEAKDYD